MGTQTERFSDWNGQRRKKSKTTTKTAAAAITR